MGISDLEKLQSEGYIESDEEWKECIVGSLVDIDINMDMICDSIREIQNDVKGLASLASMARTINDTYGKFEIQINTFSQLRNTILQAIKKDQMDGIEDMEKKNERIILCIRDLLISIERAAVYSFDQDTLYRISNDTNKISRLLEDIQPKRIPE